MSKPVRRKNIVNTGQYRKCFNHQLFEMLSTLDAISATETVKLFSGTEYLIRSVDGKAYPITLSTNKFWDLVLLKLTELVPYDKKKKEYKWDEQNEWQIYLSVKTIADSLGLSTDVDALTHLYDRVVDAINVLLNIRITVKKGQNSHKIDGYLDFAAVRECRDTEEECLTKSNAIFALAINPELIAYIAQEKVGIYHFLHSWLYLTGASQNAYVAAKRLGRHYSQNTYQRNKFSSVGVQIEIGALRTHLPSLNNQKEKDNRMSLEHALVVIPGMTHVYIHDGQMLSFEKLKKLRLHTPKYNRVKVAVKYDDHPNTSANRTTTDLIHKMNDDALYVGRSVFALKDADWVIKHRGAIKNNSTTDEEDVAS